MDFLRVMVLVLIGLPLVSLLLCVLIGSTVWNSSDRQEADRLGCFPPETE